jgi:MFS superfamily sulfate permease-like transporter
MVFRVESSLLYFNVENVAAAVRDRIRESGKDVRLVVCDLSASPNVDLAGGKMLRRLSDELGKRNVVLRLVEARSSVRDLLRADGLEEKVGRIDRFSTVADVLESFERDAVSI